jgi:hypothetical protein
VSNDFENRGETLAGSVKPTADKDVPLASRSRTAKNGVAECSLGVR